MIFSRIYCTGYATFEKTLENKRATNIKTLLFLANKISYCSASIESCLLIDNNDEYRVYSCYFSGSIVLHSVQWWQWNAKL